MAVLKPSGLFFTILIELYGQDEKDWDTPMAAFEYIPNMHLWRMR